MHITSALAFFGDPGMIGAMIPIVIFMIPIVAILAKHQQKMAEIIHGNAQSGELNELRREVAELRNLVQRQSFVLDQLNSAQLTTKPHAQDLAGRLGVE